jgi:hypothetical protein
MITNLTKGMWKNMTKRARKLFAVANDSLLDCDGEHRLTNVQQRELPKFKNEECKLINDVRVLREDVHATNTVQKNVPGIRRVQKNVQRVRRAQKNVQSPEERP